MMTRILRRNWSFLRDLEDVPTLLLIGVIGATLDAKLPELKRLASLQDAFVLLADRMPKDLHVALLEYLRLKMEDIYLLLTRLKAVYSALVPEDRNTLERITEMQELCRMGDVERAAAGVEALVEKIYVDLALTRRYAGGI